MSLEDFRKGNFENGVGGTQSVGYAKQIARGARDVRDAGLRIDDPHVRYAHFEIVVDAFPYAAHAVFGRQDLYAEEGRGGEDLLFRSAQNNADIGDAESIGAHLHALFRIDFDTPRFAPREKIRPKRHLHIAVFPFAQSTLQYFAVDVVAVGTVDGRQIDFHRNESPRGHIPYFTTILTSLSGTTITFPPRFPPIDACVFGSISASRSNSSFDVPKGTEICPRTFPFTCSTTSAASSFSNAS